MRKAYQTDLSDAEWSCIEPHLPTPNAVGRPRAHSLREILNAIFYIESAADVPGVYFRTTFLPGKRFTIASELGGSRAPGKGCAALCANGSVLVWAVIPGPVQG